MRKLVDTGIRYVLFLSALASVFIVFLILLFTLREALPAFREYGVAPMLTGTVWRPQEDQLGILSMIAGSLLVTLGSVILGVPLAMGGAIFLAEVAPPAVREIVRPAVELLAGIPSVVYGLFGMVVLVPAVRSTFSVPGNSGFNLLSASMVLAVMVLPTITNIAEDAIRAVPRDFKEGSLALGATRWQTIVRLHPHAGATEPESADAVSEPGEDADGQRRCRDQVRHRAARGCAFRDGGRVVHTDHAGEWIGAASDPAGRSGMSEGTARPTTMTREDVTFRRLVQLAVSQREETSRAKVNLARRHLIQRAAFGLLWLSGIAAVAILLAVVGYVVVQGAKVVNLEFLTTPPAGGLATSDVGGMSTTIVSTVYLVFWTIVFAGPLGILAAIYLVEYAEEMEGGSGLVPIIVSVVRFAVEILAGVPSIIFGLFGYALFVSAVALGWSFSLRSAAATGACLVLPVIIRASEEAIKAVPRSYREASLALGATKWQTAWKIVLPAAAPSSPGRSMALHVYYLAMETRAFDKAMGTGAVLILTIILINLLINIVSRRLTAKLKGR